MIYRILKIWVKAGYKHYFGNIEVKGLDRVDIKKPAIFAVNHPSAFIEPTLIATECPFDVHFITRGDVFVKQFKWFFEATNQVPVFRFKDGFSSLRNNKSSFDKCHEKLFSGAKLLIFCEGSMKWVKRLRPVQQGAAKLAMGTLEKKPHLPLVIHPIGVNYEDHTKSGTEIMVQIGRAIPLKDYYSKYQNSPREVIRELTKDIEDALKKCIVHIEEDNRLEVLDQIWSPLQSLTTSTNANKSGDQFYRYKTAANWINSLDENEIIALKNTVNAYISNLNKLKLNDKEFYIFSKMKVWDYLWFSTVGSFLKIAFELNKLPYRIAAFISKKKTPNVEFYVSVKAAMTVLLYTLFIAALLIFWSPWWQVLVFIILGKMGTYTDIKWSALVKGIFQNKKTITEANFSRVQLVKFLEKNIDYD